MSVAAPGERSRARAHAHDLGPLSHSHVFADPGTARRERALAWVVALTLAAMAGELGVGWWSGSLALAADGWHMATHALALGGALLAYRLSARAASRRASAREGYAFGGWKIEVLVAYTSGLALLGAALWLGAEALAAFGAARRIAYLEAAVVAAVGLVVNLASAWLLLRGGQPESPDAGTAQDHDGHRHAHRHAHRHGQGDADDDTHAHGHDHNYAAAYLHVLADALTSVLALAALAGGAGLGWHWLDPAVALVGAVVIARWAIGVLRPTARALVDATENPAIVRRVRELIEADGDAEVADLHVWQVGPRAWSGVLAVVADAPRPAEEYRRRLASIDTLRHVTVEVHRCRHAGG